MNDQSASLSLNGVTPTPSTTDLPNSDIEQVCRALKGIRYGEVRVIVQDGVIVQIDRLEKHRTR